MKVLILGKGVSGDGVCLLLSKNKIEYDYLNPDEVTHLNYDYVVKAPGIPYHNELIQKMLEHKLAIITDIELALIYYKHKRFIGVTASNGKTTCVTLISKILNNKYKVVACGNIGYSVCRAVVEHSDADIFVVELSSFQLEKAKIDLDIAVLLNISPCHLDHHKDFKDYSLSKANICSNQNVNHHVVYNYSDPIIKSIVKKCSSQKITFSTESCLTKCYLSRGYIWYGRKKILKLTENLWQKEFLLMDVMAAISATSLIKGITPHHIRKQLKQFEEVSYRLTKLNDYIYNDAKSTNPYSTIAAIKCFDKVELLCGGFDRKENLSCLDQHLHKLKRVYAYGQTKDKIYNYMNAHSVECSVFDSLEEAFIQALKDRSNETILFSPMFASFDAFKNYNERGSYFDSLVKKYLV